MVWEAEKFADQDAAEKENVETRNAERPSASDKGTGRTQSLTMTSEKGRLSEDEIDGEAELERLHTEFPRTLK